MEQIEQDLLEFIYNGKDSSRTLKEILNHFGKSKRTSIMGILNKFENDYKPAWLLNASRKIYQITNHAPHDFLKEK